MLATISHGEPKKMVALNGLCLVWPILDYKNVLLLTTLIVSK